MLPTNPANTMPMPITRCRGDARTSRLKTSRLAFNRTQPSPKSSWGKGAAHPGRVNTSRQRGNTQPRQRSSTREALYTSVGVGKKTSPHLTETMVQQDGGGWGPPRLRSRTWAVRIKACGPRHRRTARTLTHSTHHHTQEREGVHVCEAGHVSVQHGNHGGSHQEERNNDVRAGSTPLIQLAPSTIHTYTHAHIPKCTGCINGMEQPRRGGRLSSNNHTRRSWGRGNNACGLDARVPAP